MKQIKTANQHILKAEAATKQPDVECIIKIVAE